MPMAIVSPRRIFCYNPPGMPLRNSRAKQVAPDLLRARDAGHGSQAHAFEIVPGNWLQVVIRTQHLQSFCSACL
jgi:hypothetical protein